MFWGAPLIARELETGTYKLTWTQSATRKRWLATKLSLVGLSSIAVAGLLSLMMTWWASPIDRVNANPFALFDQRGIVPLGYAAFAFALGVTAGMLLRRTVPAMMVTIAAFVGIRLAMTWVRPRLLTPLRVIAQVRLSGGNSASPSTLSPPSSGDWVTSDLTIDGAGKVIGQQGAISLGGGRYGLGFTMVHGRASVPGVGPCPNTFPHVSRAASGPATAAFNQAGQECFTKLGIRELLTYQPTTRYWPLQWYELSIFTGLALILIGSCFVWMRRRFP